jgi:hypothetical protein
MPLKNKKNEIIGRLSPELEGVPLAYIFMTLSFPYY